MSQPQGSDVARAHGQQVAQTAADRGSDVAQHAKNAAGDVAGTAASQAGQVKDEAVRQVQDLLGQTRQEVEDQVGTQTQKLGSNLRQVAEDLRRMSDSSANGGIAANLVSEASTRAHRAAEMLEGRQPGELLDDLRNFARRRPGAFLLGAAGLGLLAGRLGRGARDASSGGSGAIGRSAYPDEPYTGRETYTGGQAYTGTETYTGTGYGEGTYGQGTYGGATTGGGTEPFATPAPASAPLGTEGSTGIETYGTGAASGAATVEPSYGGGTETGRSGGF